MHRCLTLAASLAIILGFACTEEPADLVDECTPSRTMSQPCCPDLGIDACGAGLVCAALDGRTQPTCYAESSRLDGHECSDDLLCISQSCDDEQDRCQASPGAVCEAKLGCAPDPMGYERACVQVAAGLSSCQKVNLPNDSPCSFDRECKTQNCYCGVSGCSCRAP